MATATQTKTFRLHNPCCEDEMDISSIGFTPLPNGKVAVKCEVACGVQDYYLCDPKDETAAEGRRRYKALLNDGWHPTTDFE